MIKSILHNNNDYTCGVGGFKGRRHYHALCLYRILSVSRHVPFKFMMAGFEGTYTREVGDRGGGGTVKVQFKVE